MKLQELISKIQKAVAEKKDYAFSAITKTGFKTQVRYFFQNGGYCIRFTCNTGEVYEIYANDRGYICINNKMEHVQVCDQEGIATLLGSTAYHKAADADLVQTVTVANRINDHDGEEIIDIVA